MNAPLKSLMVLTAALLVSSALLVSPTLSWVYQDGSPQDVRFEMFGPRADNLLIKLYENEMVEWDALASGEIDVADWPLSKTYNDLFASDMTNPATGLPYNETINTVSYGGELGLYILDINNNPYEYLGNPPDPRYPNPVYPNPCSEVSFRQAIAHLVNRSWLETIVGTDFYIPLYTVVPPALGSYSHPDIAPGGVLENLTYPYSKIQAATLLDSGGFPLNVSSGWRFWDRNGNGEEESDEYLELKFVIRNDLDDRRDLGTLVADELNAVNIRVNRTYCTSGPAYMQVMCEKDFHLYIGGWNTGYDPNHLILWCWDLHWHPGFCYNFAGINNLEYCEAVDMMFDATKQEMIVAGARLAQKIFAEKAHGIPLWSHSGNKVMNRFYTGGNKWESVTPDDGENQYRGERWKGAVNMLGSGIDNFWSFLNMHPENCTRGDGENLTIRWGFKVPEIKILNPVYSSWQYDWNVLSMIYESLVKFSPYDPSSFIPWLAESFETGVYNHPTLGECIKIKMTLRAGATWHDGTPITSADVYFTWKELPEYIIPPWPWLLQWGERLLDFKILDPYNFEMLFDSGPLMYALRHLSYMVVLPKHIWKPLAESDLLSSFAPDPNLIGSGPWRLEEYVESSHIWLVANRPGRTMQTNLPDSTFVTSPEGYWRYYPAGGDLSIDGSSMAKIEYYWMGWTPPSTPDPHELNFTAINLRFEEVTLDLDMELIFQNGTVVEYSYYDVVMNASGQAGAGWTASKTAILLGRIKVGSSVCVKQPVEFIGTYNCTSMVWSTIREDICGSTLYDDLGLSVYPYKNELQSPDIKIDMKDIGEAAHAFGSYPSHSRWRMGIADINDDYKVNMRDIGSIASSYGWTG